jgi:hypothetical protein
LFKDRDHLLEKWETLKPDGTKTQPQFELLRKTPNSDKSRAGAQRPTFNEEDHNQRRRTAAWLQVSESDARL